MNTHEQSYILVIDDDDAGSSMMKELLEKKFGASVETASSCAEARAKLAERSFDIATIDYRLPDGSGLDLLEELAGSAHSPQVIMVTGHGNEEVASRAFRYGLLAGYVIKDRKLAIDLISAVERALDKIALVKTNEALEAERQQMLSIFDSIDEAIYVSDPDTYEILYANNVVKRDFGDVVGKICFEALQGRDSPCPFCTNELILGDHVGETNVSEFQNQRNKRWYRCIDKAIAWPDGRTVRSEIAVDITDGKLAEDRIRFQAELLDVVEEAVMATDMEGRIIYWNRFAEKLYGLSAEEAGGQNIFEMSPASELKERREEMIDRLMSGESWAGEVLTSRKDGTEFYARINAAPIRDDRGNVSGLVGLSSDISARKRAEEALRNIINETNERREEITALLESTRYVLEHKDFGEASRAVYDLCKRLVGASSGFLALLDDSGTRAHLLFADARQLPEIDGPAEMPVSGLQDRAFRSGRAIFYNDILADKTAEKLPEGHPAIENIMYAPLVIDAEPEGLLAFADKRGGFTNRDALMASAFSEIVALALRGSRMTEALRDSEERFRRLIETAPDVFYTISMDGLITSLNPAFERFTGWPADKWIGESFANIVNPDDLPKALETFALAAEGETPPPYELRILSASGEYLYGEFISAPQVEMGQVVGEFGVGRDITARKKAEEARNEAERKYRDMFVYSVQGIYQSTKDGRFITVNPALARMLGFDSAEETIEGITNLNEMYVDPCRRAELMDRLEQEGIIYGFEAELYRRDGSTLWALINAREVRDESDAFVCYEGAIVDITESRRAEEKLRESEELYRALLKASPEAITVTDLDGTITDASAHTAELHGFAAVEDVIGMSAFELIAPQEHVKARESLERTLTEGTVRSQRYSLLRKDGSRFTGELNAAVLRDRAGNPRGFIATTRDVEAVGEDLE
jgi:PAS domain S-box-containing protein